MFRLSRLENEKKRLSPHEVDRLQGQVLDVLRQIRDPEIPLNIYDLGLIYRHEVKDDGTVEIDMTLTAPACPVAEQMPKEVETKVGAIPGVTKATVNMVWDPPWSKERLSEEAQLELGLL
jgi:FeS assembly SUF system protein